MFLLMSHSSCHNHPQTTQISPMREILVESSLAVFNIISKYNDFSCVQFVALRLSQLNYCATVSRLITPGLCLHSASSWCHLRCCRVSAGSPHRVTSCWHWHVPDVPGLRGPWPCAAHCRPGPGQGGCPVPGSPGDDTQPDLVTTNSFRQTGCLSTLLNLPRKCAEK